MKKIQLISNIFLLLFVFYSCERKEVDKEQYIEGYVTNDFYIEACVKEHENLIDRMMNGDTVAYFIYMTCQCEFESKIDKKNSLKYSECMADEFYLGSAYLMKYLLKYNVDICLFYFDETEYDVLIEDIENSYSKLTGEEKEIAYNNLSNFIEYNVDSSYLTLEDKLDILLNEN